MLALHQIKIVFRCWSAFVGDYLTYYFLDRQVKCMDRKVQWTERSNGLRSPAINVKLMFFWFSNVFFPTQASEIILEIYFYYLDFHVCVAYAPSYVYGCIIFCAIYHTLYVRRCSAVIKHVGKSRNLHFKYKHRIIINTFLKSNYRTLLHATCAV